LGLGLGEDESNGIRLSAGFFQRGFDRPFIDPRGMRLKG